jgi:lipoprotein signal peptidase
VRQAEIRLLVVLATATTVAAVDQWIKFVVQTPDWAFHHRSGAWFAGSCAIFIGVSLLALLESRAVAVGTALLAGGVLGNLMSASADGLYVPNPLLIGHEAGIAFNLADVCILVGNMTLMVSLSVFLIQRRDEVYARRQAVGRAIRRRLS